MATATSELTSGECGCLEDCRQYPLKRPVVTLGLVLPHPMKVSHERAVRLTSARRHPVGARASVVREGRPRPAGRWSRPSDMETLVIETGERRQH